MAIAGRSNVGKSSLINCLVNRRGLARTSGTPGRTRQINFFLVEDRLVLADLPGYGFAVGSEEERRAWGPLVESYLRERETLRGIVLVIDVRRGLEAEEDAVLTFAASLPLPAVVAATKIDKLGRGAGTAALRSLAPRIPVPLMGVSGRTGVGRRELWRVVDGWVEGASRA